MSGGKPSFQLRENIRSILISRGLENEKIDGVDLIRYVILDKFAPCMLIWENAGMHSEL